MMIRDLASASLALLIGLLLLAPAAADAQTPGPRPGEIEVAPIQCWWKASTTAIRIGERFTVTLTCGVVETSALTVVANTSSLDPGAVQLTPFEVVSGTRHDDILAPQRRYFQYEYQVRLLSEGFFGRDVAIPALPVTYAIQSGAGGATGRDQTYNLPALPMRVISLVPQDASDIRDASAEGFAPIEARRFRATSATVAGGILLAFSAVLLLLAGLRAMGLVRGPRTAHVRPLAPRAVLGGCLHALAHVKGEVTREGWSPALARRALTPVRIIAAVALDRTVPQAIASADAGERDGQLTVRQGLWRRRRVQVSAAATARTIDRALAAPRALPARTRALLVRLRGALHAFSVAAYGRGSEVDPVALDAALSECIDAGRELRRRSLWPIRSAAAPGAPSRLGVPSLSEERS